MSHTRKKTHTAIYHIFCFVFFITGQIVTCHSLRVFGSSVSVASGVVVGACIAHETADITQEVGTVVKAIVTTAAQAVFVQIMLLRALLFSQFEAGSVLFGSCCGSSNGSSSPVVGSRGSSRHCSFVRLSMSQVATIWTNIEKVFQFYSADSVNRWIMIKVKKIGKCVVTCHTHTACILFFLGHTSHIYLLKRIA